MELRDFINLELISHPYNWMIVILMLALSTFVLALAVGQIGGSGGIIQLSGSTGD